MKLLLIAVVFSIHASGFLTTGKATCDPMYNGGYGGSGGANVKPGWSFNFTNQSLRTKVMYRTRCPSSLNCYLF
uniref:Putative secreted protein n=1 Tax=Ixodes ricinus TaxID=34613 RepID=V5HAE6_IXORI